MSYAPDEPIALLHKERGFYVTAVLGGAAWGKTCILLTLFIQCCSGLISNVKRKPNHRYLLAYVSIMFSLGSVGIFTHVKWIQEFEIDNRNYPGGPIAYYSRYYATPLNVTGVVAYFIMNWMADSLLLFRVYVIWNRRKSIIAFPVLMFSTSFSLSVVDLITVSHPGNNMFSHSAVNFGLVYWSFSIALNVILTTLIVGRLLYMRRRIADGPFNGSHTNVYLSIAAILVESAALYSICMIVFLIGYSTDGMLQFSVEAVQLIQGVAPLMIILRVANGRAWSYETTKVLQERSILLPPVFAPRKEGVTFSSGGSNTILDSSSGDAVHAVALSSLQNVHAHGLQDDVDTKSS
ncbi:hypothetical protein BV25DRAFT_1812519 [Artomyces pyxidatus]|uniref:Uncharacterized protein n=1 Tax=Artomyces pyxidatus TaxID=48021 RepID=A0ACB8SLE5_9AGAM|nr:hypothetical protein BV25DRAFT_1812519 [Artomyces pyxidatus]